MKRLLVVLVVALLLLLASPVGAATSVVLCHVDIGDLVSEAGHNLVGWGPIEPATHPGGWGSIGSSNCRVIWDANDNDPSATITLDGCARRGAATAIRVKHLDGIADDSFDVYVRDVHGNDVFVGNWVGSPGSENWQITTFALPSGKTLQLGRGRPVEVKLVATGEKWSGFATYGQVAFDWIELVGNGKK